MVNIRELQMKEGRGSIKNVTGMEIENQKKPSTDGQEVLERRIKILENQKKELLEINKQWDQECRNMKAVYEQKLKEKFTPYQQSLSDLEKELDQKQRDFDKKLLLAKAKLETAEEQKQTLNAKLLEAEEENKHLKERHTSITKQKGYYEHEIARLNKALSDALRKQNVSCMPHSFESGEIMRKAHPEELTTQIEVLKQQVQIFEEDFQRERCDRERMNEEKEELKKNIEHLQSKLTLLNTRLKTYEEDFIKERKEKDLLGKKLKKQDKSMHNHQERSKTRGGMPDIKFLIPLESHALKLTGGDVARSYGSSEATGFSQSPTTPYPPLAYAPCAPYVNYGHPYGIPIQYPGPALLTPQTENRGYQHPMTECPWHIPYVNQLSPDQQNSQKCRPKDNTSAKRHPK
ncbi:TNFAIP3-interacting protein 3-like isoform X2 [Carcharodon carcharias]|uniref:TNFAIP3-interacting protein 3-like isoform X2 n=1 Tax=Carcharodon carcharias TaxID=13397 RepID=UPI001B7DC5D3|nr:TNFAIP3-interacting protein 3-like isoform X2 [Carcharodon carcharias]